jgi:hypothetical protein
MDGRRFDELTRGVGAAATRRRVVAAALGLAAATVGSDAAAARRATCRASGASCGRHPQCCTGYCETSRQAPRRLRNRCTCPSGECNRVCVDFDSDPRYCGGCGSACPTGFSCEEGVCLCGGEACVAGEVCFSGACLSTVDNDDNCGAIGNACATMEACLNSACREIPTQWSGNYFFILVNGEGRWVNDFGPHSTKCSLTTPCEDGQYCVGFQANFPGQRQSYRPGGECYRLEFQ